MVGIFWFWWQDKAFTFDSSFKMMEDLRNEYLSGYDEDFVDTVEDDFLC